MRIDDSPLVGAKLRDLLAEWRVVVDDDGIVPAQTTSERDTEYRYYYMAVLIQALADLEVGWDYKQGYVGPNSDGDGGPAQRCRDLPELERWFLIENPRYWHTDEVSLTRRDGFWLPKASAPHRSTRREYYDSSSGQSWKWADWLVREKIRFSVEIEPPVVFSFTTCCEELGIRASVARKSVERWLQLRRSGKRAKFGIWRRRRMFEPETENC